MRLALAVAIVLLASTVHPGEGTTVKVGNETKPAVATITALQAGDVACYLTLRDEAGKTSEEMAEFEVCETQAELRGRRARLTWTIGNVLADECQGSPDCGKTKRVALVASAKPIGQPLGAKPVEPPASFCTSGETVVFACPAARKLVSVCATRGASATRGTLQHRFGAADGSAPLEIAIPETDAVPPKAASGAVVPFSGGGGSWLRFRRGAHAYVVYSGIGNWGPNGAKREKQGVTVEKDGRAVAQVRCTGKLTSALGPDWLAAVGITDRGEDFDFPE